MVAFNTNMSLSFKKINLLLLCFFLVGMAVFEQGTISVAYAERRVPANWRKWNNFPKVPRITGKQVKQLLLSGQRVIFIYAGYRIKRTICGSIFIPYNKVPPNASGSSYNLKFPKDTWMLAYCPWPSEEDSARVVQYLRWLGYKRSAAVRLGVKTLIKLGLPLCPFNRMPGVRK